MSVSMLCGERVQDDNLKGWDRDNEQWARSSAFCQITPTGCDGGSSGSLCQASLILQDPLLACELFLTSCSSREHAWAPSLPPHPGCLNISVER